MSALRARVIEPGSRITFEKPEPKEKPLSLVAAINRASRGEPVENEASGASLSALGHDTRGGLVVTDKMLQRGLDMTSGPLGEYLHSQDFQKAYAGTPYGNSVIAAAGIHVVDAKGVSYVTGVATAPPAEFLPPGGELSDAAITFRQGLVGLRSLGTRVVMTRNLLVSTGGLAEDLSRAEIATSQRKTVEAAVFTGSGANGWPLGVSLVGVIPTYTPAGAFAWADGNAVKKEAVDAGVSSDASVWIASSDVVELLENRERVTGSGRYILEDGKLCGKPVLTSAALGTGLLMYGDFSEAITIYDLLINDIVVKPVTPTGVVELVVWRYLDVVAVRPTQIIRVEGVS